MNKDSAATARLAFPALLAGAVCIALAPILVRLSELEPVATAFYRVFLVLPLMSLWLAGGKRRPGPRPPPYTVRDLLLLMLPGVFFAGDLGVWHWSIRLTTVANATLFANFAPIFVTLGAAVLFKERFSRVFLLALAVAMCGAMILMGTSSALGEAYIAGDILGITAAVFYAAYLLSVGRLRARYGVGVIMFWSCLSAAAVLLPVSLLTGESLLPDTWTGWAVLIALAWVSHLGGQGLIAWALAHLSTALSSVSLLAQPVCAAMFAWALFGEALGPLQITGGLIVLSGIYLARRTSLPPVIRAGAGGP